MTPPTHKLFIHVYATRLHMHFYHFIAEAMLQFKTVLEPRVSPAFAITYFCNHGNIRFENTSKNIDTVTFFFLQNLSQRSLHILTPGWSLTPSLWKLHVWLYPRIIVSKSHKKHIKVQCVYKQWSILQNYHMLYTLHTYFIYYVQNEWSHVSYWPQFIRRLLRTK